MHQEHIEILNVYAPKNRVTTYVKPKLIELKGKIDKLQQEASVFFSQQMIKKKTTHKISNDIENTTNN